MSEPAPRTAPADLVALNEDQGRLFIVCMLHRDGIVDVIEKFEHTLYPPATPRNHQFDLYLLDWEKMHWAVMAVPLSDKSPVEGFLESIGWRLADGVPHVIDNSGTKNIGSFRASGGGVSRPARREISPALAAHLFTRTDSQRLRPQGGRCFSYPRMIL